MQISGYYCTLSGVTSHLPQIIIDASSKEVHVGTVSVSSWLDVP